MGFTKFIIKNKTILLTFVLSAVVGIVAYIAYKKYKSATDETEKNKKELELVKTNYGELYRAYGSLRESMNPTRAIKNKSAVINAIKGKAKQQADDETQDEADSDEPKPENQDPETDRDPEPEDPEPDAQALIPDRDPEPEGPDPEESPKPDSDPEPEKAKDTHPVKKHKQKRGKIRL